MGEVFNKLTCTSRWALVLVICRTYFLADKLVAPELKAQAIRKLDIFLEGLKTQILSMRQMSVNLNAFELVADEVFGRSVTPDWQAVEGICRFFHEVTAHTPWAWMQQLPAVQRYEELLIGIIAYSQPPMTGCSSCGAFMCCTLHEDGLCRCTERKGV